MGDLSNRVALVTGGASGIGAETCRALAEEGATVVIGDIQDPMGKALAETLGNGSFYLHLDVASENEWQATVDEILKRCGRLDVLVNNAGIGGRSGNIENTTVEEWRRVHSINVEGVFLGCKHAIRALRPGGVAGKGGSIVNLSSIAGLIGSAGLTAYCASKGAVRLLTKAAAVEAAQFGTGVRINSVHPGLIQTKMLDNLFAEASSMAGLPGPQAAADAFYALQPMREARLQPDDIANLILFLASDASRFVTGSEYVCDGGFTAT